MLGHPVDVVSGGTGPLPAADPVLTGYAAVLAEVLAVEAVDPDAHVFDDLGGDSMVMARFCARVRKRPDLPAVSIKDVYQHPTISGLAAAFAGTPPNGTEQPAPVPAEVPRPARAGRAAFVLCGVVQALFFAGYCCSSRPSGSPATTGSPTLRASSTPTRGRWSSAVRPSSA